MSKLTEPGNIASPQHRHLVRDILEWKHRIRELEAGLVRHRHTRDELAGCLDRYPFLPPESKLRLGKWKVENRVFLNAASQELVCNALPLHNGDYETPNVYWSAVEHARTASGERASLTRRL